MSVTRPNCRHKVSAVLSLTEIAVFYAFLIYIVAFLDLHPCVNDRYKADMLLLHPLYKIRKIFKFTADSKILAGIHIVDIHIDHVQRQVIFPVALRHPLKVFRGLIAPAALPETKSKFWRNIALPDYPAELLYNIIRRISADNVQIQVRMVAGYI